MLFFIAGRGILADCREILCWLAHVYGFEGCGASFAECGAPVNLRVYLSGFEGCGGSFEMRGAPTNLRGLCPAHVEGC